MNKFSDKATLSTFPIVMEGSPVDSKEENDVTCIAPPQEKLDFDDETLKGKEFGRLIESSGNGLVGFI